MLCEWCYDKNLYKHTITLEHLLQAKLKQRTAALVLKMHTLAAISCKSI